MLFIKVIFTYYVLWNNLIKQFNKYRNLSFTPFISPDLLNHKVSPLTAVKIAILNIRP